MKPVPFEGDTLTTWHEKSDELLPPPPPTLVNVGITRGVGLDRTNITVDVAVGVGVSVRGVGVIVPVGVEEGRAADVCVEAAMTVCAINVLTAPGFAVGTVVVNVGTHAKTRLRVSNQMSSFVLRVDIFPLAHPKQGLKSHELIQRVGPLTIYPR